MLPTTSIFRNLFCASLLLFSSQNLFADCQYEQNIKGEKLSIGVVLNWSTIIEKENAMFIVERSDDGLQFTNIGAVKGAGQSSELKKYSFLDKNKTKGQYYYRLRQVDHSGAFATSSVFIFNNETVLQFPISNISASSSSTFLEIQFNSALKSSVDFELMDEKGKSLLAKKINAKKGINTYQVNLENYTETIYQLTFRSLKQEQTIIFKRN